MDGERLAARRADPEEPVVVADPFEADVGAAAGHRLELVALVEAHLDAHRLTVARRRPSVTQPREAGYVAAAAGSGAGSPSFARSASPFLTA